MKSNILWRFGLLYTLMAVFGVAIVGKALYIQLFEGENLRKASVHFKVKDAEVLPNRGDICAEDERKLASSLPYYELRFDASVVKDKLFDANIDSLALCLAGFFKDERAADYRQKLQVAQREKKKYFLVNKRKVSYSELKTLRKFPIFRLGRNKGGLIEEMVSVRKMPHEDLAVRTIGYVNAADDGSFEGRVGIEAAYEKELKGIPGRSVRQMMSGTWVPVTVEEPEDGCDVITTINVDFQDIVQEALLKTVRKYDAEKGVAVLMDVKTGDIKAISNLTRKGKESGVYKEEVNYAISDAGEPGSVIKAAVMIALLEDGYYELADTINLGSTGKYTFYDQTLHESDGKKPGKITVKHLFETSSNGIAVLANEKYKSNPSHFIQRLYGMGLKEKTGIPLKGEGEPYIKYPDDKSWTGITLPWMSVGYEMKLTPLQVLAFYNAIANGGQRMCPRLVKEIKYRGEVIKKYPTEEVGGLICSKATLKKVQELLEGVVENGTAKNIQTSHYKIAGKTGTARIATGTMGYDERRYRASFVGYFPANAPLYSCIVVVDDPDVSKGFYANQVVNPVFKEIADKVYAMSSLRYGKEELPVREQTLPISKNGYKTDFQRIYKELNLPVSGLADVSENEWVMTSATAENIVLRPRRVNYSKPVVPNVKGMGLKDAVFLLENAGLKVEVSGAGMVQRQSVEAGENVKEGGKIRIELN
ncbi:penicillin-binding protein [Bacteroidia bacterium]|nr:penicillin-binding protein [Bacteroidia bacterium]